MKEPLCTPQREGHRIDPVVESRIRVGNAISTLQQFIGELVTQEYTEDDKDTVEGIFYDVKESLEEYAEHLPEQLDAIQQELLEICDEVINIFKSNSWISASRTYNHLLAGLERLKEGIRVEEPEEMSDQDYELLKKFDLKLRNKYTGFQPHIVDLAEGDAHNFEIMQETSRNMIEYFNRKENVAIEAAQQLMSHTKKEYRELADGFNEVTEPFMKVMREIAEQVLVRIQINSIESDDVTYFKEAVVRLQESREQFKVVADKVGENPVYRYYRDVARKQREGDDQELTR